MSDTFLADALPGAYAITTPRKPVGSRRDRELATLRVRVAELEEFVDVMAGALAELRRHVQFHGADLHTGCGVCCPTDTERATALEFDRERA